MKNTARQGKAKAQAQAKGKDVTQEVKRVKGKRVSGLVGEEEEIEVKVVIPPCGRCRFGWCCCPVILWCGAAFPLVWYCFLPSFWVVVPFMYENEMKFYDNECK